jgi:hypothetical protein
LKSLSPPHPLRFLGPVFVMLYLPMIIESENDRLLFPLPRTYAVLIVRVVLKCHRSMHMGTKKSKPCKYCYLIYKNKEFLQNYVPNPKLYPPFSFVKTAEKL